MARTLIGQLIIRFSEEGARQTARTVNDQLGTIERRAKQLGALQWGQKFQSQLGMLKLSPQQLAAVKASFDRLPRDINGAVKKADLAEWKTAVLRNFATVETRAKTLSGTLKKVLGNPAVNAVLAYGGYRVVESGLEAGAQRDRAIFRMEQAGVPEAERQQILDASSNLSGKYPGMSASEIVELALRTRSTMGDTDRTLQVLESLVKGQIVLMSARDPSTGADLMDRIVKAADVLGQNAQGPEGIANVANIVDGLVRSAQAEGSDFDPGSILDFARRAKTAGAGWSNEFVSTFGPAIMQDLGGPQSGTALASAFKSFVLGDNSINGKVYRGRQADLGVRDGVEGDLVQPDLFTSNPYEWTSKVLVPALQKAGVDLNNDGAVAMAVGKLSGSSTATAQLTRFIQQMAQYEKTMANNRQAMGIDAASAVGTQDPFVAWRGLANSFSNLAGAIAEHVDVIAPGLNTITGGINALSAAVRDNPLLAGSVGVGVLGGGLLAGGALYSGLSALVTAGPSLQTAAGMLMEAAAAQGAGGAAGAAVEGGVAATGAGAVAGGILGSLWKVLRVGGAVGTVAAVMKPTDVNAGEDDRLAADPAHAEFMRIKQEIADARTAEANDRRHYPNADNAPVEGFGKNAPPVAGAHEQSNRMVDTPFGPMLIPGIDAVGDAADAASEKISKLSNTVKPSVDKSELASLEAMVDRIIGKMRQMPGLTREVRRKIEHDLHREVARATDNTYIDIGTGL